MKTILIDGKKIQSLNELHEFLAKLKFFPSYYGKNLDALWDVLTTYIEGPIYIIWKSHELSKNKFGEDFDEVKKILVYASKDRDDLTISFE